MSIGNWKHAPNLDAAVWACQEVWPRIRRALAAAPACNPNADPSSTLPNRPSTPSSASQSLSMSLSPGSAGAPDANGTSSDARVPSSAAPGGCDEGPALRYGPEASGAVSVRIDPGGHAVAGEPGDPGGFGQGGAPSAPGNDTGGSAWSGVGGAAGARAAAAERLPELHLYGAYESHACRKLHAPDQGVFVKGHAPTLEVLPGIMYLSREAVQNPAATLASSQHVMLRTMSLICGYVAVGDAEWRLQGTYKVAALWGCTKSCPAPDCTPVALAVDGETQGSLHPVALDCAAAVAR